MAGRGFDPFGSMQGFVGKLNRFFGNPNQFLSQNGLNIPQNMTAQDIFRNPDAVIQNMMNSGQLSQEQYNWAQNMARQIQGNPMFQQLMGKK